MAPLIDHPDVSYIGSCGEGVTVRATTGTPSFGDPAGKIALYVRDENEVHGDGRAIVARPFLTPCQALELAEQLVAAARRQLDLDGVE
jgi:hypothetical protein